MNATVDMDDQATHPVHRQDGIALWRQIAGRLQARYRRRAAYKPGTQLPTEAELSARFGVNRHTVRRALEELSRDGLVRVEQGRGSSSPRTCWTTPSRRAPAFSEWIRKHNKEPSGIVRQLAGDRRRTSASPPGSACVAAARSCCWNASASPTTVPSASTRHYFPADEAEGPVARAASDPAYHRGAARRRRRRLPRLQTRVTARLPTQTEADLLRMARNRPVLVTENSMWTAPARSSNSPPAAIPRRACKSFSSHEGTSDARLRIAGGTVLLASDGLQQTDLSVRDGLIDRIGGESAARGSTPPGCWCCPGSSICTATRSSVRSSPARA